MKKIIALGLLVSVIPMTANATTHHYSRPHIAKVKAAKSASAYKQYRHQRLLHARKGVVVVYSP